MNDLIYKHERPLFGISLAVSVCVWLLLVVATFGMVLLYLPFVFVMYLFAQSALIAYIKGNAVKITPGQYPDLYERLRACCDRLHITTVPDCYLLNGQGGFNAFATRFLGRNFVVLFSDIVDAMEGRPGAVNFYLGHELGHIQRQHLVWHSVLLPASILPLLGAAYARARETTCDFFGAACCEAPEDALAGLAALAAGGKRWQNLTVAEYLAQAGETGGFWMSFHELVADYPWLVKRVARVLTFSTGNPYPLPSRSPLAYFFALGVPRTLASGAAGGGILTLLMMVAVILIIAAIAIPSLLRARIQSNEAGAVSDLREIVDAETTYQSVTGHYSTLACLSQVAACQSPSSGPPVLDQVLGSSVPRRGYERRLVPGPPVPLVPNGPPSDEAFAEFAVTAVPLERGRTGVRAFCADSSGLIYYTPDGREPDVINGRCDQSLPVLGR